MVLEKIDLEKIIPKENIKYNEPMSKHTSFKTGGPADCYITVSTIEEIRKIAKYARKSQYSFMYNWKWKQLISFR